MGYFTYTSKSPISINDLGTTSGTIDVYGIEGAALDVRIDLLGFEHDFANDVDLLLVAVAFAAGVWVMLQTPAVYRVYTAASLVAPLCLVFPARPFMSMPRFVLVVVPVFWALARFSRRFHAWEAVVATSAAGLGILSLLFVNWYWVY